MQTVRPREIEPGAKSYADLRAGFRWQVPARFNIAWDVCGRYAAHPATANLPALHHAGGGGERATYTFAQLWEAARRLAAVLAAQGIAPGDRVAILLPQCPQAALAHLATYALGAIAIPLTVLFRRDALSYRLENSGAKAIILARDLVPLLEEISPALPDLQCHIAADPDGGMDGGGRQGGALPNGWLDFAPALAATGPLPGPRDSAADDPALIIYTSGTTGNPKGALHAHRLLIGHLPGFELSHDFFPQAGDCFYTPADWAWIGGLFDALLAAWHYGKPMVSYSGKGFDPEFACRLMAEYGVRNAFLPPTALKMMSQIPRIGSRSGLQLRSIMSGGEALGAETLAWAEGELGVRINEIYGQTEMNYLVGNCAPLWPVRPGSMGLPYPGHDVAVVDAAGNPLPPGEMGEVAVRRGEDPVFFLEYWNNPQATAEKFIGEWALSGDLAETDEKGYLWFKGRKDDVIISAGYRIGPTAVEAALCKHPDVAMAAVIGAPHPVRGEIVKAFVRPRPGVVADEALARDIQEFVKQNLSLHEYPREVEFLDELPLTTTGKIRRLDLRQREAARRSAQREDATPPAGGPHG